MARIFEKEPIEDHKRRLAGLQRLPHSGIALNETYREERLCSSTPAGSAARALRKAILARLDSPLVSTFILMAKRADMLNRAVLTHLKLADLPVRLPHEKCWVTVLHDLPIHFHRLNKILLIGREPANAPIC